MNICYNIKKRKEKEKRLHSVGFCYVARLLVIVPCLKYIQNMKKREVFSSLQNVCNNKLMGKYLSPVWVMMMMIIIIIQPNCPSWYSSSTFFSTHTSIPFTFWILRYVNWMYIKWNTQTIILVNVCGSHIIAP